MHNVLKVLKRDVLRLVRVPQAMVVVLALLILPSLYTWYNVLGFWNPYENTGDLRVAVVNQDLGSSSDLTGPVDVGQMIVDELQEDHQLDWQFLSYDDAMRQVDEGRCYAAFVIPEDFSQDLLTITTGDFVKPEIEYLVNEKTGPVAPKITDTGANTLDAAVNEAFVETVSKKAAEALDDAISESEGRMDAAKSYASSRISDAKDKIRSASVSIESLIDAASDAQDRAEKAKGSLDASEVMIADASDGMDSISKTASELQKGYLEFSSVSVPLVTGIMQDAADVYSIAASQIAGLPVQSEEAKEIIDRLEASAKDAQDKAQEYSRLLADGLAPRFGEDLADVATTAAGIAGSVTAQSLIISQACNVMDDMVSLLDSSAASLEKARSLLSGLLDEMDDVQTDVMLLANSDALVDLFGQNGLDAQKVSEFISSPTFIVTEQLYPLNSYGAAMAPLFMNLTFWIGAFMLMVILRQEVDSEGVKKLTLSQRYFSRYLLYAVMVTLQAVICCAGLPVIGVEVVNLPALFFAAVVSSLSYLSIIYALSVTLQHIGKGICIVLVFAQIPGATGLYPIEMTSPFFQAIFPLLPFTYGISAMRESICGFYGLQYLSDVLVLCGFLVVFMAAGNLLRPLMSNVNRMVARQIKQSGIFFGESVEVPIRRYRLSQVLKVLADREDYRKIILRRYAKFQRIYPFLIKGSFVIGIAVPVVAALFFSFSITGKVILLTIWLVWIVAVFIFLIVVESLRMSFARQLRLDSMSDAQLRDLFLNRNGTESADVVRGAGPDAAAGPFADVDGKESEHGSSGSDERGGAGARSNGYDASGGDRDA